MLLGILCCGHAVTASGAEEQAGLLRSRHGWASISLEHQNALPPNKCAHRSTLAQGQHATRRLAPNTYLDFHGMQGGPR